MGGFRPPFSSVLQASGFIQIAIFNFLLVWTHLLFVGVLDIGKSEKKELGFRGNWFLFCTVCLCPSI